MLFESIVENMGIIGGGGPVTQDNLTTKDRLLDAAEQLFASKNFSDVSIRELAAAADVNVAAVNYHFQGKDNLYREVILRRFAAQRDRTLAALDTLLGETGGRPDPGLVVEALVGQYVRGTLAESGSPSFLSLMSREMQSHSSRTNVTFFKELVAPIYEAYTQALLRACPDLELGQISWVMASIVGQVHHFVLRRLKWDGLPADSEARSYMAGVFPVLAWPLEEYMAEVIRQITRFSTAAIEELRKEVAP